MTKFTGKSTITNPLLDEIHTGTIWDAACKHYCGNDPNAFSLPLVCFYDKTHTDLHGLLACAPFICTPAFLNRDRRNNDSNYMVLGYIPNLGHGKGKTKRQTFTMRLQYEHDCLALITKQIIQIQTNGGFCTEVMGEKYVSKYGFILSLVILRGIKIWLDTWMDPIWNTPTVIANVNSMNCLSRGQNANLSHWMKSEMQQTHVMVLPNCQKSH
jgi:hypothetical protein